MKLTVLKELPQGQQPGDTIEIADEVGEVLILVGAAVKQPDDMDDAADEPRTKRHYKRRDLQAQD